LNLSTSLNDVLLIFPDLRNLTLADLSGAFTGNPSVGKTWLVPLRIFSATAGIVQIDDINLTYNPNPVYLNVTSIRNYQKYLDGLDVLNFSIGSVNGTLNLTDLRYDYSGGNKTYEVLAHTEDYTVNSTINVTYYFSQWDYNWIPNGVEWIYFNPGSPTAQNVTPYGQNILTPLLNITNYGYGGKNATLSVYMNDTLSCVDTIMSLTGNKEDGIIINNSWQDLANMSYLETVNISMWSDYNCSYSDWHIFNPSIYFRQCVDGGLCSEELI